MSGAERCVNTKCHNYGHIHEGMCSLMPSVPDQLLAQTGPVEYQHGDDDPIIHTIKVYELPLLFLQFHESGKVTWKDTK